MADRKGQNKRYPPDFDPAKIPKRKQPRNKQQQVRDMLSMSIRCNTCGNYMYKGTKINSRKEVVVGKTYMGIEIFRFYFKCTNCSAEITKETDPQNSDYIVVAGATRNFEPWRDQDEKLVRGKRKRAAEEMGDTMKSLENRTLDSKRELDILAALDEMKSLKSRHATVSFDAMLEAFQQTGEEKETKLEKEEEALIKSVFQGRKESCVRRIDDEEWGDDDDDVKISEKKGQSYCNGGKRRKVREEVCKPLDILLMSSTTKPFDCKHRIQVVVKSKPVQKPQDKEPTLVKNDTKPDQQDSSIRSSATLQSLCQYDSDDDKCKL